MSCHGDLNCQWPGVFLAQRKALCRLVPVHNWTLPRTVVPLPMTPRSLRRPSLTSVRPSVLISTDVLQHLLPVLLVFKTACSTWVLTDGSSFGLGRPIFFGFSGEGAELICLTKFVQTSSGTTYFSAGSSQKEFEDLSRSSWQKRGRIIEGGGFGTEIRGGRSIAEMSATDGSVSMLTVTN